MYNVRVLRLYARGAGGTRAYRTRRTPGTTRGTAAVAARTGRLPSKRVGSVETGTERRRNGWERSEIDERQQQYQHQYQRRRRSEIRRHCQFDLRYETGVRKDKEARRHPRQSRDDVQGFVLRTSAVQRW